MKNAVVFCITLEDTVQLEAYWDSSYVIPQIEAAERAQAGWEKGFTMQSTYGVTSLKD